MTRGVRHKRWRVLLALVVSLSISACHFGNRAIVLIQSDAPSVSHGTSSSGGLKRGKRMPSSGPNFSVYSTLGALFGRISMHGRVLNTVLAAYAHIAAEDEQSARPKELRTRYIVGEAGWPSGGAFWPHRTHQNGLSVDFMVPVEREGKPSSLPTWPWEKFGYGVEFDSKGCRADMCIDFKALARHLCALKQVSRAQGTRIKRVILAPELRPHLNGTPDGRCARRLPFMRKRAWVRHDDHVHVDFALR